MTPVSLDQATFAARLRRAVACTAPRGTQEVAKMVRIAPTKLAKTDASPTGIEIGTTDFELQFLGKMPATFGGGKAAVPTATEAIFVEAAVLLARVLAMPPGEIRLSVSTGAAPRLSLRHGASKRAYTLPLGRADEYPPVAWGKAGEPVYVGPGATLARLIDTVASSAAAHAGETVLHAVRLQFERALIIAEAASSPRAARYAIPREGLFPPHAPNEDPFEGEVALVLRTALAFAEVAREVGDGIVRLLASPTTAFLSDGTVRIGAGLPALPPSPIGQLFATFDPLPSQEIVVDKRAFSDALRAVSLATAAAEPGVHLVFVPGALHVVADAAGEACDELPVASPVERAAAVQVDAGVLLDVVKHVVGDDLAFGVILVTAPTKQHQVPLFLCEATKQGEARYLLSPIDKRTPAAVTTILEAAARGDEKAAP